MIVCTYDYVRLYELAGVCEGPSAGGRVGKLRGGQGSRRRHHAASAQNWKETEFPAVVHTETLNRRNIPEPGFIPIMHLTTVHGGGVARSQLGQWNSGSLLDWEKQKENATGHRIV